MDYTMLGAGDPPLMTVQIDAAINPGNSGGAVFNEALQVCASGWLRLRTRLRPWLAAVVLLLLVA